MRVLVLGGGPPEEHDVSMRTARALAEASLANGHETLLVAVEDGPTILNAVVAHQDFDVSLIGLHGPPGEDGRVQALLELVGLPYPGSGPTASALAMDKALAKRLFLQAGIPTPMALSVEPAQFPVVVKPTGQGSSVGVACARNASELASALAAARRYGPVLVEEFVSGRELSVAIVDGVALDPIEIMVEGPGLFDNEAKYSSSKTRYESPPTGLSTTALDEIRLVAERAFAALGCLDYGRVDVLLRDTGPVVLEVNTLPGCSARSLFPMALRHAGVEFQTFVGRLLERAHARF